MVEQTWTELYIELCRLLESAFPGWADQRCPGETAVGWAWTSHGCATYWHLPRAVYDRLTGGRVEVFQHGHTIRLYRTSDDAVADLDAAMADPQARQSLAAVYPAHGRWV